MLHSCCSFPETDMFWILYVYFQCFTLVIVFQRNCYFWTLYVYFRCGISPDTICTSSRQTNKYILISPSSGSFPPTGNYNYDSVDILCCIHKIRSPTIILETDDSFINGAASTCYSDINRYGE